MDIHLWLNAVVARSGGEPVMASDGIFAFSIDDLVIEFIREFLKETSVERLMNLAGGDNTTIYGSKIDDYLCVITYSSYDRFKNDGGFNLFVFDTTKVEEEFIRNVLAGFVSEDAMSNVHMEEV